MTSSNADRWAYDLYQETIIDHNKNPRNFGTIPCPSYHAEGFNTLCGDHFYIDLSLSPEGMIQDIRFRGAGCAISMASASLMTEELKGKTLQEARSIFHAFHERLMNQTCPLSSCELSERLQVLQGVGAYPTRIKCATLPWHVFKSALDQSNDKEMV